MAVRIPESGEAAPPTRHHSPQGGVAVELSSGIAASPRMLGSDGQLGTIGCGIKKFWENFRGLPQLPPAQGFYVDSGREQAWVAGSSAPRIPELLTSVTGMRFQCNSLVSNELWSSNPRPPGCPSVSRQSTGSGGPPHAPAAGILGPAEHTGSQGNSPWPASFPQSRGRRSGRASGRFDPLDDPALAPKIPLPGYPGHRGIWIPGGGLVVASWRN